MPEKKELSAYNRQKLTKPEIEDMIHEYLSGETRKDALGFVAWLRANGMPPKWFRMNGWTVTYKGVKRFCDIWLHAMSDDPNAAKICDRPRWGVSFDINRQKDRVISEGLSNIIWDNITCNLCTNHSSGRPCAGGRDVTVFDKKFVSICQQRNVNQFYDPNKPVIEGIKKLLGIDKKAIDEGDDDKQEKNDNTEHIDLMLSLSKEQKQSKPMVESIIPVYLNGDSQKNALDLVVYMRESKINPGWYGVNRWKASSKGTGICFLALENGYLNYTPPLTLRVRLDLTNLKEYEESIINEGLQSFVLERISYCHKCSGCAPGKDVTLFGKELKSVCRTMILFIHDPDEAAVSAIKKLLRFEKRARQVRM